MAGRQRHPVLFAVAGIGDYFVPGTTYPLADFLMRSREAYGIASERVRKKFGFPCSRAAGALAEVEGIGGRFPPDAVVKVEAFEE